MVEEYKIKRAIVSGASHALKFKEKNPHASDADAIKHVTSIVDEILYKIEGNDEN